MDELEQKQEAGPVSAQSQSASLPSDPRPLASTPAAGVAAGEPVAAAREASGAAPAAEPGPESRAVAATSEAEPHARASRVPALLLVIALAVAGGTTALAAVQKSIRAGLFVVQERAAHPGTVEKYGERPEMWLVYPELRTPWSCRLHGGQWESQTWQNAAGKQNTRSLCRAD